MVRTVDRTIDDYIQRLEARLLRKHPDLEFETIKWSEQEATVYYRPYSEQDDFEIIHRASSVTTDALVDSGYRILVTPARDA